MITKKTNTGAASVAIGKTKIIDNWTALDSLDECANKWTEGEDVEDEEGGAE